MKYKRELEMLYIDEDYFLKLTPLMFIIFLNQLTFLLCFLKAMNLTYINSWKIIESLLLPLGGDLRLSA